MTETTYDESTTQILPMSTRELLATIITGAASGFIIWAVYQLLVTYVMPGIFCKDAAASICVSAPNVMEGIALVVGAVAGLLALIRQRTFRPLLIVLAATLTLGGMMQRFDGTGWLLAVVMSIVLYGLAYGLFAWIARLRSFILAVVIVVVMGVVTRLVLLS